MRQAELFAPSKEGHPYAAVGERLWSLARQGIYFGSSSWKYESWKGTIYVDSYTSKKDFEANCLEEYARVFPAVGGDFSFYNWPSDEMIERIGRQTPDSFKIGLKCTEFITLKRFPAISRWGANAGKPNPDFLNVKLFGEEFLKRVRPIQGKLAPIIMEFTAFPKGSFADWAEFASALEVFFVEVRKRYGDEWQFGVELRTRDYLHDDFFAALKAMGPNVAPIINSWTRTPPMDELWHLAAPHEFGFVESRPVMRPGRTRDEAVLLFEPYDRNKEVVAPARRAMKEMVHWALEHKRPCYVFINNHLEGCAHQTIAELTAEL